MRTMAQVAVMVLVLEALKWTLGASVALAVSLTAFMGLVVFLWWEGRRVTAPRPARNESDLADALDDVIGSWVLEGRDAWPLVEAVIALRNRTAQ